MDILGLGNMVGNIGASIIQARNQTKNNAMTIQANKNMAEYAYNKDLEQWNRANEFNSPVKQMTRLKSAGLNPNMVYGSGSATGNTAQASSPKYNPPDVTVNRGVPNLMNILGSYQDIQMKKAQIDNVKEDTRVKSANVWWREFMNKFEEEIRGLKIDNEQIKNSMLIGSKNIQAEKGQMAGYQRQMMEITKNNYEKMFDLKMRNLEAGINRAKATANLDTLRASKVPYEREYLDALTFKTDTQSEGIGYENIVKEIQSRYGEERIIAELVGRAIGTIAGGVNTAGKFLLRKTPMRSITDTWDRTGQVGRRVTTTYTPKKK